MATNQETDAVSSSLSPSVDRFAEVLSEAPSWYNLGVYLKAPMVELDAINRSHNDGTHEGTLRCLMELYRCLERKGKSLSWETIASALRRMGNHAFASKIDAIIKEELRSTQTKKHAGDTKDIDYLKVYDKSSAKLVEAITNPRKLAPKLREAGLISCDLEKDIAELIPGVSNDHNADLLVREVRKLINVCHDDRNKQRQKLILFCRVLLNSEDPALSEIGSDILKNAGISQ